ncbi:CDP-alcohol phosphatidyltransferase family protein [Arcanobacterium haemolyticum]|uniref:phosphatidylinositol phosphate synthase n=1 Tax=Arcanobacterium haemolyticum TaxID=28264 RepID=UPI001110F498|nr:CDP-alcohol phosphatidyltransferase family protein [Arcanobacterium haemolyticum]QCX46659.1 CDP-alcohol phosphatidyltransferase family protein [Arcanobacterium haemolyticum]
MLSRSGRPFAQLVFGPVARLFVKLGIGANIVTWVGTVLSCASALFFLPRNMLITGTILTTIVLIFDNLDGQIARLTKSSSAWGSFLDSTLDRVTDAVVFAALAAWGYYHADPAVAPWMMSGALASGLLGSVVPYSRAKAESIGCEAAIGFAERADRLVFAGVCTVAVGLGASHWILAGGMWVLALLAGITVIQRMLYVRSQLRDHESSSDL